MAGAIDIVSTMDTRTIQGFLGNSLYDTFNFVDASYTLDRSLTIIRDNITLTGDRGAASDAVLHFTGAPGSTLEIVSNSPLPLPNYSLHDAVAAGSQVLHVNDITGLSTNETLYIYQPNDGTYLHDMEWIDTGSGAGYATAVNADGETNNFPTTERPLREFHSVISNIASVDANSDGIGAQSRTGGNGYHFILEEAFNTVATNLNSLDYSAGGINHGGGRHSLLFSAYSAEHYNQIHFITATRDINFHGSIDSGNYIVVENFDYSTMPGTISVPGGTSSDIWNNIHLDVADHHPHQLEPDINQNSIADIFEILNRVWVTGTFTGGPNADLVIAMPSGEESALDDALQTAITGNALSAEGLGGNDRLIGADGNDTLNGGNDQDKVEGQGGNDSILGGGGNDTLYGGSGNDTVSGNSGNDIIYGDSGADVVDGGSGTDTLSFAAAASAVSLSLASGGTMGDASGDTYLGIEIVSGSNYGDSIAGNSAANTLNGRDGNDSLFGGVGNDTLNGGDGSDTLYGDAGSDSLVGGNGSDVVDYVAATSAIILNLTSGGTAGDASGDIYSSIETVKGSNYADSITGDTLANTVEGRDGNDSLYGGTGNDTLIGGEGSDTLYGDAGSDSLLGGNGTDMVSYAAAATSISLNLATGGTTGDANGDTYASVEVVNGSNYADAMTGDALANTLNGRDGNDTLNGGSGNDSINSGDGNDSLLGGSGVDTLVGGAGTDTISGYSGNDLLNGGTGTDLFVFQANWNADTIQDFADNIDTIDLQSFGYANVSAALAVASQIGADVKFDFGGGDSLLVLSVTITALTDDILI